MINRDELAIHFEEALEGFLRAELDVSHQFASLALEATDGGKIDRNTSNALKGYNSILHFLPRASLTDESRAEIEQSLAELRDQLIRLGVACELPAGQKAKAASS